MGVCFALCANSTLGMSLAQCSRCLAGGLLVGVTFLTDALWFLWALCIHGVRKGDLPLSHLPSRPRAQACQRCHFVGTWAHHGAGQFQSCPSLLFSGHVQARTYCLTPTLSRPGTAAVGVIGKRIAPDRGAEKVSFWENGGKGEGRVLADGDRGAQVF